MTKEQIVDAELSKDSRLVDVEFVFESQDINLTSYALRPFTTASFDGSFDLECCSASL